MKQIKSEIRIGKSDRKRMTMVATCTEGLVRYEWVNCRYNQIIPMNWETTGFVLNYGIVGMGIDDAYNLISKKALELKVDYLILIEDDVLIPYDFLLKMHMYQKRKVQVPVVSGLYYLKSKDTRPLIFRGRGNGAFIDFKIGDKVWCDGLPMGCLMIHTSLIKYLWDNSPEYKTSDGEITRKVFETPRETFFDPMSMELYQRMGTQDLNFFDRILKEKVLEKTGWKRYAKKEYPFLCDTSLFCKHIDRQTGIQYP